MAVRVNKSVWTTALKAQEQHGAEWSIKLLLRAKGPARNLGSVFDAALGEVHADRDWGDVSVGEWGWVATPGGLHFTVTECDDFTTVMNLLVRALSSRGVTGSVALWRARRGVEVPDSAPMIACRLRVAGVRTRVERHAYRWDPDERALSRMMEAAERWCTADEQLSERSLRQGISSTVEVTRGEPVASRMVDAVLRHEGARSTAVGESGFRAFEARSYTGALSLVIGGTAIEQQDVWPSAVEELAALLRECASDLVYAHLWRGWLVNEAMLHPGLPYDWPPRQDHAPAGLGFTSESFEDLYAPDAYAIQLVGPGYADRVSLVDGWNVENCADGRRLVSTDDLGPWFEEPFVHPHTDWLRQPALAAPSVLQRARSELARLLYAPGVLAAAGHADAESPGLPSDG